MSDAAPPPSAAVFHPVASVYGADKALVNLPEARSASAGKGLRAVGRRPVSPDAMRRTRRPFAVRTPGGRRGPGPAVSTGPVGAGVDWRCLAGGSAGPVPGRRRARCPPRRLASGLRHRQIDGQAQVSQIGIALHAGAAIVGNVGSAERKEYTYRAHQMPWGSSPRSAWPQGSSPRC